MLLKYFVDIDITWPFHFILIYISSSSSMLIVHNWTPCSHIAIKIIVGRCLLPTMRSIKHTYTYVCWAKSNIVTTPSVKWASVLTMYQHYFKYMYTRLCKVKSKIWRHSNYFYTYLYLIVICCAPRRNYLMFIIFSLLKVWWTNS